MKSTCLFQCETYVDGGGLREEVEEVGAPSRGVLEGRGAADGDHEQGTQGGLVQVGRLALRHLDARDAQGPHIHLQTRGGEGRGLREGGHVRLLRPLGVLMLSDISINNNNNK
jgi:hypothetical protein